MRTSETIMEGLMREIEFLEDINLEEVSSWFEKIKHVAKILAPDILLDLPPKDINQLRNRIIIASDGSVYQKKFSSMCVILTSACTYSTEYGDLRLSQKFRPKTVFVHPYGSDIIASFYMKALEYFVTLDAVKECLEKRNPDLVLLDGTMTFPEDFSFDSAPQWIQKVYKDWLLKYANEFFEFCYENAIPVVSITKAPIANKFLNGIRKQLQDPINIKQEMNGLNSKELFISEWEKYLSTISEMALMKHLMWDKELLRTKTIEVSRALRLEIPIERLKGNVIGFYFKPIRTASPLFVEVPAWIIEANEKFRDILNILTNLCIYSPISGYPSYLYFAHKTGLLKRKFMNRVISVIHRAARQKFKENYSNLFSAAWRDYLE